MNGPQHFVEAERLLAQIDQLDDTEAALTVAAAQVHATLAQVAATVTLSDCTATRSNHPTAIVDRWHVVTQQVPGVTG